MGNSFKWVGWRREREVFKIYQQHLDKIISTVKALRNLIEVFSKCEVEKLNEAFNDVFNLEREADDIKERIIVELSKGPFHPIDREDIMRLILTSDDIAAHAKAASRKLLLVDPCVVPEDIRKRLITLVDMSLKALMHLKHSVDNLIKNPKEAISEAEKVERMEEEVDEFRVNLIIDILKWGDTINKFSRCLVLKEAVENIENMTDRMEDTADVVRGLAITS